LYSTHDTDRPTTIRRSTRFSSLFSIWDTCVAILIGMDTITGWTSWLSMATLSTRKWCDRSSFRTSTALAS